MVLRWSLICLQLLTSVLAFLDEGDLCLDDHGRNGTCTLIHNCPEAKEMLLAKQLPTVCGFEDKLPLVCCISSPDLYSRTGSVAEKMCEKYSKKTYRNRKAAAFTEETALIQKLPHMAALGYGEDANNIKYLCTGALISERFVLTAAHCLTSPEDGRVRWVRLGDPDLAAGHDDAAAETVGVERAYSHPDYSPPVYYNDVALLRLARAVTATPHVRPACLQTEGEVPDALLSKAAWGKPGGRLVEAPVDLVPRFACDMAYDKGIRLPDGVLDECLVCAGAAPGREICTGDSGAPLQAIGPSEVRIIGVATFGKPCTGSVIPGGYARVSNYLDWIEPIVWSDQTN